MVTLAELTALKIFVPVLLAVMFPTGVVLPIAPLKVMFPVPEFAVRLLLPSTAPFKLMLPLLPVPRVTLLPSKVLPLIVIF